jgi:NAD(P)-dependent dehydrogenase (short-subunit alcohol dehydrogenase family)
MASYLITGAGRGLGLELVTQLLALEPSKVSTVFATTRSSPSKALQDLIDKSKGRVVHIPLAVTDKSSIDKAVNLVDEKLAGKGLDVVINNAGIQPFSPEGIASMDNLREALEINVEAVHNVTAAFLPLLRKSQLKKVVNM